MLSVIVFILVLSLVIMIHELGHFIAARRAGILCHEFALGMGPVLWSKKVGETTYSIRAIPIGGYVSMAGEELNTELVKVGDTIRVYINGNNNIEKIALDHKDEKYENFIEVTVERIDLTGENDSPLYINEFAVSRKAMVLIGKKEIQIAPAERSFNYKNKKQRFLAIFGGPFMNFVLAFFVFILFAMLAGFPAMNSAEIGAVGDGFPAEGILEDGDVIRYVDHERVISFVEIQEILQDNKLDRTIEFQIVRDGEEKTVYITPTLYFYSIGLRSADDSVNTPIIGPVLEGTKAYQAGFQEGDQLVTIDGNTITTWDDVAALIEANVTGETMEFDVLRDGTTISLTVDEPWNKDVIESQGLSMVDSRIGINPMMEFRFFESVLYGFEGIGNSSTMIFDTLRLLFSNDQVGAGDLAGPLGIYQITASALDGGFVTLLGWIGLLSVNLGVINLLPIPALDGGRLVFLGFEAVTGKKPNQKVENTLHYIMFLLLMGLFVFITYNDLLRLFNLR